MSSWTFKATANITKLNELSSRLGSIPTMLEDVVGQIAEETRRNIRQKNIIDTGALLRSITHEPRGAETVVLRDGVTYGVYNEFGTSRMPARPFMIPASEKFAEIATRKFTEIFR